MKRTILIICAFLSFGATAQPDDSKVIDRVIAVVGKNPLLLSDLETQLIQYLEAEMPVTENTRCNLFEELLYQNLLLHQAQLDSLEISEGQVEQEMERRMRYYLQQFGSQERMEEFLGKSVIEWKAELRKMVKDQLLAQQMQTQLTDGIEISPQEVKDYFNTLPKDSLPFISSELKIAQIVRKPPINESERQRIKDQLEQMRQRVINGEDFKSFCFLYSEDPGSRDKSGELGFFARGSMVPQFEAVAFRLKPGEISEIVETDYGYHLIQGIERRGEEMNVRHLLMIPKVQPIDMIKASTYLDSVMNLIDKIDTLTFEKGALKFSDDKESANNGGLIINQYSGTTTFDASQLSQIDPSLAFSIQNMKVGEISQPVVMQNQDGSQAYRVIKLVGRTDPHVANLRDDYQKIQDAALNEKKARQINEWVEKRVPRTYIKIDSQFVGCTFRNQWFVEG